jgi:DNA-binding response OmpR family regulator
MTMLHQRQAFTCPCCGGFIGEAASIDSVSERVTGQQRIIIDLLGKQPGRAIPRDKILFALYGDRYDGGPDYSENIISVNISRLRKLLHGYGWDIVGTSRGGAKSSYRLIPLEAGAC